jgi:Tol biopolymer transport system component
MVIAATTALVALAVVAAAMVRLRPEAQPMRFRQVTFRRGQVAGARFTPSRQEIVYSARWDDEPRQCYLASLASPSSRSIGFEGSSLASVSKTGELALLEGGGTMNITGGTLSRAPIGGGPVQRVGQNVFGADWSPDGARLAVVRVVAGAQQIEYPLGTTLYRTPGWISNLRISPDGQAIAFIEHPVRHDDAGEVKVIGATGKERTMSSGWVNVSGLAWTATGEVWFTATRDSAPRSLWAVTQSGRTRAVGQAPGILTLRDIAPDGKLLVTVESRRLEIAGRIAGDARERSFSLTDWSRVQQLSADGGTLLFDESGEGAGQHTIVYACRTRTGEVIRLGEGVAQGLTTDGAAAFVLSEDRKRLRLVPISRGQARDLAVSGLEYQWARPFPAGDRLLALAGRPGQALGLYVQTIDGRISPLTGPMMVRNAAVSPDGAFAAVLTPEGLLTIYPVAGGQPRVIPYEESLAPVRWSRDGESLFVQHLRSSAQSACDVSQLRVATGELRLWKRLKPADIIGVNAITGVVIADDEVSYAYSYRRILSDLFVAEGWK